MTMIQVSIQKYKDEEGEEKKQSNHRQNRQERQKSRSKMPNIKTTTTWIQKAALTGKPRLVENYRLYPRRHLKSLAHSWMIAVTKIPRVKMVASPDPPQRRIQRLPRPRRRKNPTRTKTTTMIPKKKGPPKRKRVPKRRPKRAIRLRRRPLRIPRPRKPKRKSRQPMVMRKLKRRNPRRAEPKPRSRQAMVRAPRKRRKRRKHRPRACAWMGRRCPADYFPYGLLLPDIARGLSVSSQRGRLCFNWNLICIRTVNVSLSQKWSKCLVDVLLKIFVRRHCGLPVP